MMNLEFGKNVSKKEQAICLQGLPTAMKFMNENYPEVSFKDLDLKFSKGWTSRYFRNEGEERNPYIFLNVEYEIRLYNMKSLKLKRTVQKTDLLTCIISTLVHELTHHVQYENGLPVGELLTTKNQLNAIYEHDRYWFYKFLDQKI